MISIRVNDSEIKVAKQSSLAALMVTINPSASGIAVAVNNRVISKQDWQLIKLQENDVVLVITATQGG